MCEYVAGELILCFPKADDAARNLTEDIREGKVEHVDYVESLEEKLSLLQLKTAWDLYFEFHRIHVPAGEETWKITYLHSLYKEKLINHFFYQSVDANELYFRSRFGYPFIVTTNSLLTIATRPLGKASVHASDFVFSSFHHHYKALIGAPNAPFQNLDRVTIAILDTGVADDTALSIVDRRNFTNPQQLKNVKDENGHGTVIGLILQDLAPTAKFVIYKVADAEGRASEWDTLAALATCGQSNIINLSLQFGLGERTCSICGRESQSSRSIVFESILSEFSGRTQRPFIIAAAGNSGLDKLAFPSRFDNTLAIGAINSKGRLSAESNYGLQNSQEGALDSHFVLPGGDDATLPPETIGEFGHKDAVHWHGTSFAVAYASGLLANHLAQQASDVTYGQVLDYFRQNADKGSLLNYSQERYGHGLLKF